METPRISRIEVGTLIGERPRNAGSNARIGAHGKTVRLPLARVTTEDGATGFGLCRLSQAQVEPLLGTALTDAFLAGHGASDAWLGCEYPLWDLVGKRRAMPVYALVASVAGMSPPVAPPRVRCYDTSLYIDDLHLPSDEAAAALIATEAREGYDRGHRAFKIKIGRGARWMPLDAGTRRDIAVIRAVREAVGQDAPILLDANNGYNLNLTKQVLRETADCGIFWMEEAFHEDAMLYRDLKEWLAREGLPILIADGEGQASPTLMDWAHEGLVDVVQYDIFSHGFTRWLQTGRQLDGWRRKSAPHHYGGLIGNYVAGHLAGALSGFTFVEWDEAQAPGLNASAYTVEEGWVSIPDAPGFGLGLDDERFRHAVANGGFTLAR